MHDLTQVFCWFESLIDVLPEETKSLPDFVTEVQVCFNMTDVNVYYMSYKNTTTNVQLLTPIKHM